MKANQVEMFELQLLDGFSQFLEYYYRVYAVKSQFILLSKLQDGERSGTNQILI